MPCGKVAGTDAIANSGEAEPAERLKFVLALHLAESTRRRRRWAAGSRPSVGRLKRGGCVGEKRDRRGWNTTGTSHYIWVMNAITSILGTVSATWPSAYDPGGAEPPGRPRVQKTQKDPSDSSSTSISPPVPRTNSRKRMSARLVNKKSSNRVVNSAFVAVSSDAASQFTCSDRLILIAARESLLQCDG